MARAPRPLGHWGTLPCTGAFAKRARAPIKKRANLARSQRLEHTGAVREARGLGRPRANKEASEPGEEPKARADGAVRKARGLGRPRANKRSERTWRRAKGSSTRVPFASAIKADGRRLRCCD